MTTNLAVSTMAADQMIVLSKRHTLFERVETANERPDLRHRNEHAGNNEGGPTTVEQLE